MKRRLFFFCLLYITTTTCYAQSKSAIKAAQQLRTDITYLSSDELQGRRTGSEGERKAAAYIEQHYRQDGLQPYAGNYLHPFKFIFGKEIALSTRIIIGGKTMRMNEDAFPLPFSANKHAYSEVLPDIMEQGNIWLINLYTEQSDANSTPAGLEKIMYDRSREAQKQGAAGVLFYDGVNAKSQPFFNVHCDYETVDIPVAFLRYDAYQRFVATAGANDGTAQQQKSGLSIELNVNINKPERTGTNITAYIDNKAAYTVIIGAHYDHLGMGEDGNGFSHTELPHIYPGADDNASGTAGLLQLAARIKKSKLHHYNYLFVNFSGEELDMLGSKHFIKDVPGIDSNHIAYMLNMDMIGRFSDSSHALTVGGTGTSPVWGRVINRQDKHFKIVPNSADMNRSDHWSFYRAGIPVLFFFTGLHQDYHKPTDIVSKINYTGEAKILDYVYNVVTKMDKETTKPRFTPIRENGKLTLSK